MLPNFLVIGAQKSGTTWFHNMLRHHPDVFVPRGIKETMFLDTAARYAAGSDAYRRHFADAGGRTAVGEVTPGYLWCSPRFARVFPITAFRTGTPARARALLGPDLRLIAILRDPVRRAVSAYLHHAAKERVELGDSILRVGRANGIISMGFYADHLTAWLAHFPMSSLLVIDYEALSADPVAVLRRAFAFLAVDAAFVPRGIARRYDGRDYDFAADGVAVSAGGARRIVIPARDVARLGRLYAVPNRRLQRMLPELPVDRWLAPG